MNWWALLPSGASINLILVIFAWFQFVPVLGSDPNNRFINPPAANSVDNPVWVLGETQVISWKTTLPVFNVSFWQQSLSQESGASAGNIFCMYESSFRDPEAVVR